MSDQPHEPILDKKGPSAKTIFVIFLVAAGLFLLGYLIDASARSKDESVGAMLPILLGFVLIVFDLILFIVWAVRRAKSRTS